MKRTKQNKTKGEIERKSAINEREKLHASNRERTEERGLRKLRGKGIAGTGGGWKRRVNDGRAKEQRVGWGVNIYSGVEKPSCLQMNEESS